MSLVLALTQWTSCRIGSVEARFEEIDDEGNLVFVDQATDEALPPIPVQEFEEGYAEGRNVRLVEGAATITGPFREDDRRLRKAMGRQFLLRRWDQEGHRGCGRVTLCRFLTKVDPQLLLAGYRTISAPQLARDIVERGTSGQRPLALMFDRPRGRSLGRGWVAHVDVTIAATIDFYYERRSRSVTDAVAFFKVELRAALGVAADAELPHRSEPHPDTIRRRIRVAGTYENVARKYGLVVARARLTGVGRGLEADMPLETVVLDATKVDTWVVVDEITGLPLGRPVVTLAIDVATRMVVGIHVGIEGESLEGLLACVFDILRPKHWLRTAFPEIERSHDGWGLPLEILWDNALRQVGVSAKDNLAGAGIDCRWTPIGTPTAKSIGERIWDTLNTMIFHKLPGGVPFKPDVMEKLGIHPDVEARIPLAELRKRLMTVLVDQYHYKVHSTIGMQPARAWRDGIAIYGRNMVGDLAEVERLLGTYDEVELTREGIRFRNHRFHDRSLVTDLIRSLAPHEPVGTQRKGRLSSAKVMVKVKYSPGDCSRIHVFDARSMPPRYVTLPNFSPRYSNGLSFKQADMIRNFAKRENIKFQKDEEMWAVRDRVRRMIEGDMPALSARDRRAALPFLAPAEDGPIVEAHGLPSASGQGTYDVVVGLAEITRTDGGLTPPQARRGGRAASAKAAKARKAGGRRRVETETFLRPPNVDAVLEDPVVPAPTPVPVPRVAAVTATTEELLKLYDWEDDE